MRIRSSTAMPGWFKAKTAVTDAVVLAGIWFASTWWFWQVLSREQSAGIYVAMFAGTQLLRFINAQLGALEWAKLNEASLVEKKTAPPKAMGDGYREAAVIDEPTPVEDEALGTEIAKRRRIARTSLGIIGGVAGLASFVPAILWGLWTIPLGVALVAALGTVTQLGIRSMRDREAKRHDYFTDRLARDTSALLEPKKARIAAEAAQLRVGVDFGVPAADTLDADDELATRDAKGAR